VKRTPIARGTRRKHLEAAEQRLFVQRWRLDPRTCDLPACAIPNGGKRGAREAALMKAEGVSAGAPDWVLFVARGGSHGLALEFKSPTGKGRQSPAQKEWAERLWEQGWRYEVVTSAHSAWGVVSDYLRLEAVS
jgi:hypothetical protein